MDPLLAITCYPNIHSKTYLNQRGGRWHVRLAASSRPAAHGRVSLSLSLSLCSIHHYSFKERYKDYLIFSFFWKGCIDIRNNVFTSAFSLTGKAALISAVISHSNVFSFELHLLLFFPLFFCSFSFNFRRRKMLILLQFTFLLFLGV